MRLRPKQRNVIYPTFGPEVFRPLQFIHRLQGFCLFMRKSLLIVEFTGPAYPIEKDAATRSVFEKEENGQDKNCDAGGTKGRQYTNKDTTASRAAIADIYNNRSR